MNVVIDFLDEYGADKMQEIRESNNDIEIIKELDGSLELISQGELNDKGRKIVEFANADHNPSSEGYKRYDNFETLKDGEWVCSECELDGSQIAACIRNYRNLGFVFDSESNQGDTAKLECDSCGEKTTHRRMKYPFPVKEESLREDISDKFRQRVKEVHNNRDAFDDKIKKPSNLEVDHRKPRIRCDESEDIDFENITDDEIKEKFQLTSQTNNTRKSRACERCKKTGCRQSPLGTDYFYKGDEEYTEELGCEGCFFYDPDEWRDSLNRDRMDSNDSIPSFIISLVNMLD